MKILFVNKFFFLNGGSERVFFQERDFLKNQGHHIFDFSMDDSRNLPSEYSDYFVPNINYLYASGVWKKVKQGASFIHSPVAVKKIEQLILQHKPEIAHLHNIYHQLTPSIIQVLKKNNVKVVLTLHDYKLICPSYLAIRKEEICTACQGKHFLRPILTHCQGSRSKELILAIEAVWHKWRKSYDGVDSFIAPSQFIADFTSKRIQKSKLVVLHNGIDLTQYTPHFLDNNYALYFGRLSKQKGIKTLLNAHNGLYGMIPLKVVGTGPLAEDLQLTYPNAKFMGYRSGNDLNELIANAAFVVVPSEGFENCSMVVLEAMAFGKPIIGSRIGGIPEQIDDGKTGYLYEMGNVEELSDKMLKLWSDSKLRKNMGMAAREKLEKQYALEDHCQGLLSIYNQLLSN